MAEVTPNLGLKKPLESEFVSIQTLNENMDKVDQSLGPVDDLPTTAKNAAGAISELYDQLADKPHEQLTLTPGVQIVQGGDVPAILRPTMQGRTLVNLLGKSGNGEDSNKWSTSGTSASISTDTSNKVYGLSSLKITATGVTAGASNTISVVSGKHYLAISEIKNGTLPNSTSMAVFFGGRGNAMPQTEKFAISYIIHSPSSDGNIVYWAAHVPGEATSGQYFNADGMRVFEITAAEKSYINSLTTVQAQAYIAIKFPYVDDMKHVNAVYIENKGKNLLPPFSEWKNSSNLSGVHVIDDYSVSLVKSNAPGFGSFDTGAFAVIPRQTYSYYARFNVSSASGATSGKGAWLELYVYDSADNLIINATSNIYGGPLVETDGVYDVSMVFTMPTNAAKAVAIVTFNNGFLASVLVSAPMLNIGYEPLPFEPQKPSYLYLPDCNLLSNVDGSVADRLYTDGQGKPRVTRRFKELGVDGSFAWAFHTDYVGYKRVYAQVASTTEVSGGLSRLVKYNGKIMSGDSTGGTADSYALFNNNDTANLRGQLYVTIPDTDSGWGVSYTPTADEIKAYFYGWKMYQEGSNGLTPYTSGNKWWAKRRSDGSFTEGTNVLPTISGWIDGQGYTPYRLMYQLAQSVDESVTYEGSLMLHEGVNQVEVGTGIVVREAATPYAGTHINGGDVSSLLKCRLSRFVNVYKNGQVDRAWDIISDTSNEKYRATIKAGHYDYTAVYYVTYLAFDTYTLGVAPQTISAEYVPNIRESVESLVREVVEARTEITVLQNTKAQNQQPQWIVPTLLSEWTNRYGTAGYYRDDSNIVHFKGFLQNGITAQGTVLFYLPKGYRPLQLSPISTLTYSTNSDAVPFAISIDTNGSVTLAFAANSFVALDGISFRAEQ